MSDAAIIGLAHGVPVLIASVLTRSEGVTTIAMVAMFAVAYFTGSPRFFSYDFGGVMFGSMLGYAVVEYGGKRK